MDACACGSACDATARPCAMTQSAAGGGERFYIFSTVTSACLLARSLARARACSVTRSCGRSVCPFVRAAVLAGLVGPTGLLGLCGSVRLSGSAHRKIGYTHAFVGCAREAPRASRDATNKQPTRARGTPRDDGTRSISFSACRACLARRTPKYDGPHAAAATAATDATTADARGACLLLRHRQVA